MQRRGLDQRAMTGLLLKELKIRGLVKLLKIKSHVTPCVTPSGFPGYLSGLEYASN